MKILLLGAGFCKELWRFREIENGTVKIPIVDRIPIDQTAKVVRLDINKHCNPDVLWDIENRPLPFEDNEFDEIHAYEVLEHIGQQGDFYGFFDEFNEYARLLKNGGKMVITTPKFDGMWAWGDPGHRRVINNGTLTFLLREEYEKQMANGMSDYRDLLKWTWRFMGMADVGASMVYGIEVKK